MTMAPKTPSSFSDELIDRLLAGYSKPEDLTGKDGILKQLTARLVERALQSEMTEHLGYERHDLKGRGTPSSRNGTGSKTLTTEHGLVEIEVPRDRDASFEPQLVKKRQTRFTGFEEKILGMCARGMTVRDIQGHLEDIYGATGLMAHPTADRRTDTFTAIDLSSISSAMESTAERVYSVRCEIVHSKEGARSAAVIAAGIANASVEAELSSVKCFAGQAIRNGRRL